VTVSSATLEIAYGQVVTISEIVESYDDDGDGRHLGTYITLFIPARLADAPPASTGAPAPSASPTVEAPATPPPDPVDNAIALLKESGLVDGSAGPLAPPEEDDSSGGSIEDLLPELHRRKVYLPFVKEAMKRYTIRSVDGALTEVAERQLRELAKELLA
jgi:hypothetical protein